MADVFVSYARPDIAAARAIAERLERAGFSVWWDKEIPIGTTFDDELNRQLDAARSVVVLWSRHSIQSEWVRNEAAEGLAKKSLFPLRLDLVRLPFGYRRVQTADLLEWAPGDDHDAIERLVESLRDTLGESDHAAAQSGTPETPGTSPRWIVARWRRSLVFRLAITAFPVVAMGIGAVAMAGMRLKTRVRLDLVVARLEFAVGGHGVARVLDPLAFSSLRVEHFAAVALTPKVLRITSDQTSGSSAGTEQWLERHVPGGLMTMRSHGTESSLWLERRPGESGGIGTLDGLYLPAGAVVSLERKARQGNAEIALRFDHFAQPLTPAATAGGQTFRLFAQHVDSPSVSLPGATDNEFDVEIGESSPTIDITSESSRLDLGVRAADLGTSGLLTSSAIPVRQPLFMFQNSDQAWESTLLVDGTLSYPDNSEIPPVAVYKDELIGVDGDPELTLTQIGLAPNGEGLEVTMTGMATKLRMRSGEVERDGRLTALSMYRSRAVLLFWATLGAGVLSAMWSVVTTVRELRA